MTQTLQINVEKLTQFNGHKDAIYSLEEVNDTLISGGGDNLVAKWSLKTQTSEKLIAKSQSTIYALKLILNNRLVIGQRSGEIHVIDLNNKKLLHSLSYTPRAIFGVLDNPKKNVLYTISEDGHLCVWSMDTFKMLKLIKVSDQSLRSIDIDPIKQTMAVGASDNDIYIYDISGDFPKPLKRLKNHQNSVFSVKYLKGTPYLVSGSRDAHLNIWDAENNYDLQHRVPAHNYTVNSIVQSPDHKLFATGSRDKTIKVWNTKSFKLLKVIDLEKLGGHSHSVNKLLWSEATGYLISAGDDRKVMVWDVKSGS